MGPLPVVEPISSLSPTGFAVLHACPLRLAYQRARGLRPSELEPQQALGTLCHAVLQSMVEDRSLLQVEWEQALDRAWERRLAQLLLQEADAADWIRQPPTKWPGYAIKRARLRKATRRLRELLRAAGEAQLICEQPLAALGGRLRGFPDLIVRGPDAHWVIDYKTGSVVSRTGEPREAYVHQLQLYALMEREASGSWPSRALLLPLAGEAVEADVSPAACELIAAEMLDELNSYNALSGETPPGRPSPEACRWCPAATECPEPWEHCDEGWAPALLTLEGVVEGATPTRLGGVSLVCRRTAGSIEHEQVALRNVLLVDHPAVANAMPGATLRAVGLRSDGDAAIFTAPRWARIAVSEDASR